MYIYIYIYFIRVFIIPSETHHSISFIAALVRARYYSNSARKRLFTITPFAFDRRVNGYRFHYNARVRRREGRERNTRRRRSPVVRPFGYRRKTFYEFSHSEPTCSRAAVCSRSTKICIKTNKRTTRRGEKMCRFE